MLRKLFGLVVFALSISFAAPPPPLIAAGKERTAATAAASGKTRTAATAKQKQEEKKAEAASKVRTSSTAKAVRQEAKEEQKALQAAIKAAEEAEAALQKRIDQGIKNIEARIANAEKLPAQARGRKSDEDYAALALLKSRKPNMLRRNNIWAGFDRIPGTDQFFPELYDDYEVNTGGGGVEQTSIYVKKTGKWWAGFTAFVNAGHREMMGIRGSAVHQPAVWFVDYDGNVSPMKAREYPDIFQPVGYVYDPDENGIGFFTYEPFVSRILPPVMVHSDEIDYVDASLFNLAM